MNPIPRHIKQRPWAPVESLAYITPREGQFLRAHPDAPNAARLPDVGPLRRVNGIPAYWMGGADADAEADAQAAADADALGAGESSQGMGQSASDAMDAANYGADQSGAGVGLAGFNDAMNYGADQSGAGVGLSGRSGPGIGEGWGANITGQGYADPNMTAYDAGPAAALAEDAMMMDRDAGIVAAMAQEAKARGMDWGNLVKDQDTARERAIRNRDKLRGRDLDPAVERAMWTDEKDIVPFLSKLLGLTPFDRLRNMQMSPFDDPDGEWGGGDQLRNLPPKLVEQVVNQGVTGPSGWVGSYEPGHQLVRTGQDEELMPQGWQVERMTRLPASARRHHGLYFSPFSTIGSMIG